MKNKYLKNSIISFILTLNILLAPVAFLPKKTEAQGVNASLKGIVTMIPQLPQCATVAAKALVALFPGLAQQIVNRALSKLQGAGEALIETAAEDSVFLTIGVPVIFMPSIILELKEMSINVAKTKQSMENQEVQGSCLNGIAKLVAKMLLQKITISTVNWINSGYDGAPMFIQNPGNFFKDIAKNEILQFNLEIQNPELFPFGKQWMQNQANAFKKHFADNAQYSLNDLIKKTTPEYSAAEFGVDFSKGGWNAWDYMTQVPANNPYGFGLMASAEMDLRLGGTLKSTADEIRAGLQEAAGYLGMEKCVNPKGITREEHNEALKDRLEDANGNIIGLCKEWQYVTPGGMIADAATKTINTDKDTLIGVDDLNGAITAILDAVLNQFTNKIFSKGFSNISYPQVASEGGFMMDSNVLDEYVNDFEGYDSTFLRQNIGFNIRRDLTQAIIDEQRIFGDKLVEQNKELNSTTDGKPYRESEEAHNGTTNAYGLIPTLYQLDYCIPGPHPGWENHSKRVLQEVLNAISPETDYSLNDKDQEEIGSMVKKNLSVIGNTISKNIEEILGSTSPAIKRVVILDQGEIDAKITQLISYAFFNWINNFLGNGSSSNLKSFDVKTYYSLFGMSFTDINIDPKVLPKDNSAVNNLLDRQAFSQAMNNILDDYILLINNTYKATLMPSITAEAATEFRLQRGYVEIYKSNIDRISSTKSVVGRLTIIKNKIEKLNEELKSQTIKDQSGRVVPLSNITDTMGNVIQLGQQGQYEENLKPIIYEFGRLSSEMVTGDDIAVVDNRTKEIVDKKNYIYNTLIKGTSGCERQLQYNEGSGIDGGLPWQVLATKRTIYPAEILYNYNRYQAGDELPDPYNRGIKTYMPPATTVNTVGPGFLSWANFSNKDNSCSSLFSNITYIGCIDTTNYFPTVSNGKIIEDDTKKITPIGRRSSGGKMIPNTSAGIFESLIGIF